MVTMRGRLWRLFVAMLALALVIGGALASPAFALVAQWHYPSYEGCTVEHYTEGDHASGGNLAYAYSDVVDYSSCATYMEVKTSWCKNYYCETNGYNWTFGGAVSAFKTANILVPNLDLVRGWSDHCIDDPPFLCSSVDFSGDLIP